MTSKEQLISIVANHSDKLLLPNNKWNSFSVHTNLPTYEEIKEIFSSWKNFKKEVLIYIARQNKDYFYTNMYWDQYAEENSFPSSKTYRVLFDGWDNAQKIVHGDMSKGELKKKFLLHIAKEHIEKFKDKRNWDNYARHNKFPILATYSTYFGNWDNVLKLIIEDSENIKEYVNLKPNYRGITKEELAIILKEHADYLNKTDQWSEYARIHALPSLSLINRHFSSFNKMKKELAIDNINQKNRDLSKKELIIILNKHANYLHTMEQWSEYARIYALPSVDLIIKQFSSFNEMKKELAIDNINHKNMDITKEELILILNEHIDYLHTMKQWREHAKIHALPSLGLITKHFTSFNQMKKELAIDNVNYKNRDVTKEKLMLILNEHAEYLHTMEQWSEYANLHALPSLNLIRKYFSSFTNMKKEMEIEK
ncbi:hypothetical protein [Viridibacillus arvi]|uniref:hypothetical protein n=1 Tax=Viridibacillus arvi TaxID=263475 RepID=UPI0034CDCACA